MASVSESEENNESWDGKRDAGPESIDTESSVSMNLPHEEPGLPLSRIFSYSVGHFYNDLCACLWFSYLLLFFERMVNYSKIHAGTLFLIGQVTDAVCTPLVGWGSDRLPLPRILRKYGKRKTWHLLGTIFVSVSFPFIFNECYVTKELNVVSMLYYGVFIMIFQFGWSAVQISHLALIPELTNNSSVRTTLNSLRYVFTVVAAVSVYVLVYKLIKSEGDEKVSSVDITSYRNVDWIVVGVGLLFSAAFHVGTKESRNCSRWHESLSRSASIPSTPTPESRRPNPSLPLKKMYWTDWLKEYQFYQVGLLYMCSRLYINISQVYFPFYIQYTQGFSKGFVAIFPLVVYLTAFLVSSGISLNVVNRYLDRKATYLLGCLFAIGCCIWLEFYNLHSLVFGASVVMGVAQAILLVTSLAITADLIGRNTESGAFVYGAMSFMDKLSNGVVAEVIQYLNENFQCGLGDADHCKHFYRKVMVYVPGCAVGMAVIIMISLLPHKVGQRNGELQTNAVAVISSGELRSSDRNVLVS